MSTVIAAASRRVSLPDSGSPLLDAWVGLCGPMAEVTDILNSSSLSDPAALDRLSILDAKLHAWYENLPPELRCSDSQIIDLDVTAYGLHMQFCKIQIFLHRSPCMVHSRKRKFGESLECGVLPGWTPEQSGKIIYQSAIRIARLLLTYRQIFGVNKIPSIMLDNVNLAATTLISHILQLPNSQAASERDM
jgi:hypothetical protein